MHWNSKQNCLPCKFFASDKCSLRVHLMTYNTTAVARICKMGASFLDTCNSVTKQIWELCIDRNLWISAAYVPGVEDTAADEESTKENLDAEWKLNPDILAQALDITDIKPGWIYLLLALIQSFLNMPVSD